jgi:hypothetical protein
MLPCVVENKNNQKLSNYVKRQNGDDGEDGSVSTSNNREKRSTFENNNSEDEGC